MFEKNSRRDFLIQSSTALLGGMVLGSNLLGCRQPSTSAANTNQAQTAKNPHTKSVTDFRGVSITVKAPVQRIVCLLESALSGLYMLGAQDRLVGIPANVYNSDVAPHYAKLDQRLANQSIDTPGNWDFISLEKIIALKPDVVIMWAHQREGIAALEARGISVYGVFIDRMEDVDKEIHDFSILTGTEKRAKALLDYTRTQVEQISKQTQAMPPNTIPKVYYAWGQSMLETSCRGSMVDDMIRLAGGKNVCTQQAENSKSSLEQVLQWNPDVIVLWPSERRSAQSVLNDTQWRNVAAIVNRRVYQLPETFFSDLWTLKYQYSLHLMAHWFHPKKFPTPPNASIQKGTIGKLYGLQQL